MDLLDLIQNWEISVIGIDGGWLTYPSEKYMKVNWDDEIPNYVEYEKHRIFQTTNQMVIFLMGIPGS